MNITLRHLKDKLPIEDYLFKLVNAKNSKKILNRYIKESSLSQFYLVQHCIKKLPLDLNVIDKTIRDCHDDPGKNSRYGQYSTLRCMQCWVKILENPDKFLNSKPVVPKFLLNPKPKARPDFLR